LAKKNKNIKNTKENSVKIPKTDEEKDNSISRNIRRVIRNHRKFLEQQLTDAKSKKGEVPLCVSLPGELEIPIEEQKKMTAQDCIHLLRGIVNAYPNKVISRNYFRVHSGIKETTWTNFFGKFLEFKRQAGVIQPRGAHRLELYISKHASADVYRSISEERRQFSNIYLKPKNTRFKTILAFSDLHDVDCDPFALRVLLDTSKRLGDLIDLIVINGDLFDLPEFSRWNQDPRGWGVVERIKFVHEHVLDPLRGNCPKSQIDLIEGNHESRLLRHLADANPAMPALLADLHGWTIPKLLGIDEYQVNYIANGDLSARTWTERDHQKEYARNWKVYYGCLLAHHFPAGQKKNMPGFNGHHHVHQVFPHESPLFGQYEWHQLGGMHVRQASYTDGERWSNGFALVHVDTEANTDIRERPQEVRFEYVDIGDFAVSAGKFYERHEEEYVVPVSN